MKTLNFLYVCFWIASGLFIVIDMMGVWDEKAKHICTVALLGVATALLLLRIFFLKKRR